MTMQPAGPDVAARPRTTPRPPAPQLVQSGVIPFRRQADHLQILLITNRSGSIWLTPKGHLEPGLTPWRSAAREAWEEAGVVGRIGRDRLAAYTYAKQGVRRRVDLYPLEVAVAAETWPEMIDRDRRWAALDAAVELVAFPGLARCLREFADWVDDAATCAA